MKKEIIAYRMGGIWHANVGGFIITLHYTRQTKKSVLEWAEEQYQGYTVTFS